MCDETTNRGCCEPNPPWEPPQVIPAQMRRVNNPVSYTHLTLPTIA